MRVSSMLISCSSRNSNWHADLGKLPYVKRANYKAGGDSVYLVGTRFTLIQKIMAWVLALNLANAARMFVLRGAAGTGKSTIAREICARLQAMNRLGASFFFVQSDAGDLASTKNVIPTIAFQLAALQHGFRLHIANAAREYTKFESASLKDQLKSLIVDPVASARAKNPWLADIPIIIVLDALDEAGGDLVNFLRTLKQLIDAQYNIWVFVTTRPESSVDYALHESGMNASMEKMNVEDVPRDEVNADIQRFLQGRFTSLRWRNELLAAYPNAVINLTIKAERLFIYARTALEYIRKS
jgi:hypothetical protein